MSAVREPCPNCQLPYYTDRNSDCPYCGAAGVTGSEPEPAAEPDHGGAAAGPSASASASADTGASSEGGSSSGGLLSRLRGLFGG